MLLKTSSSRIALSLAACGIISTGASVARAVSIWADSKFVSTHPLPGWGPRSTVLHVTIGAFILAAGGGVSIAASGPGTVLGGGDLVGSHRAFLVIAEGATDCTSKENKT